MDDARDACNGRFDKSVTLRPINDNEFCRDSGKLEVHHRFHWPDALALRRLFRAPPRFVQPLLPLLVRG